MSAVTQEMFDAAELIAQWDGGALTYKLYTIPREAIHEGVTDEADAHYLVGLDNGNVRRVKELLDLAYGATLDKHVIGDVAEAAKSAPEDAREILESIIAKAAI